MTKTDSPDPVARGQTLTYTLTASNVGPAGATGGDAHRRPPGGRQLPVATPSQGSCNEDSGTVTCDLGPLAAGANASVDINVVAQSEGTIANTAVVTAAEADPVPANNSASEDTTVTPAADLSLEISDSPDPVPAGQPFIYTVVARNDGPSDATAVVLTDTLPPSVFFDGSVPSQGNCTRSGATLTCELGSLASSASATVEITLRAKRARTLTNTATVSGGESDPDTADNTDEEETLATSVFPPYPRPGSATPLRIPLVMSYADCASPNGLHVVPLDLASCAPPQAQSPLLTTSTAGSGSGSARLQVLPGSSLTPEDEADVVIGASASDVRCAGSGTPGCAGAGADYTERLILATSMRITDLANGALGADPGTVEDAELSLPVDCSATPGAAGATCSLVSSAESLVPGWFVEEKRTIVSLLSLVAADAGPDGSVGLPAVCPPLCGTGDESTYLRQGLFAP